jgi:hypothetical protein
MDKERHVQRLWIATAILGATFTVVGIKEHSREGFRRNVRAWRVRDPQ